MAQHGYTAAIYNAETLYSSLESEGVDMSVSIMTCIPEYTGNTPTGNTLITITTDALKALCDTAIAKSLVGTLQANKQAKKDEISAKSNDLVKQGLAHTTATGNSGVFPIENSKEELSFYHTVADSLAENPLEVPQIIPTVTGGGVPVMTALEAATLDDDVRHRMEYIYTSVSPNADSSKSQLLLDAEINAVTTQLELDAILDTRV